ncbi:MAG: chromate transporter [Candidatus Omnitrophica bacterium]|nr:chromate transporter [Candidatus Omnitrophota bacterium]MBL7150975.1 chromate transporter [Candidatus Omnitrophota bacterium]MBL7210162.1 chromate transporter [Candidatus Omnitrophota bacterium]
MILIKLFITFLKVGLFTIGSGYSMLVLAQRYVVENYHWLTIEEFTDVVSMAEVTPGPIMINLATFVGSRVAGLKGAVFATVGLIVIPFLCIYLISINYDKFKDYVVIQKIMKVIRPMAIGFITVAILKLLRTSITDLKSAIVAILVIIITYVFKVNPIYTVIGGILFAMFL